MSFKVIKKKRKAHSDALPVGNQILPNTWGKKREASREKQNESTKSSQQQALKSTKTGLFFSLPQKYTLSEILSFAKH